ncbi:KlcB family protein [Pseudomonas sp. S5D5]|uniref:KlcB family protein n=1 Tax=Pseudomonas sp. S5D5 TaxID=2083056 RepID=UPI000D101C04|nr:KlcB family protein [Pseudomonas sp. S5D5]
MAKKKAPAQELPLEQQPLFLKTLEFLPDDRGELEQLAADMLQLFNDAMIAASARDIETSALRYNAVVYRLHGNTFMGSGTKDGAGGQLCKKLAAPAGVVPGWGQAGEYLLEVEGMRLRVVVDPWGMSGTYSLSFYAVDASAKFISETGYLSQFLHPDKHVGQTFGQAVRGLVEQLLQGEFKPKAIREDERAKVSVPAWLVPALQGVTRNGQLNMPLSGEPQLSESVKKVPMSNAERQQLLRQRRKERAQSEGLKLIPLTRTDRMVLSLGLLAHEDLDHRPKDWVTSKKPGFDALLTKLWPEGDNGRYLAEPNRSTYRPTAFLRDELERQRVMVQRLQDQNSALRAGEPVAGQVIVSADDPDNWTRTVQLTRDEDSLMAWAFSVFFTARADLDHLKSPLVLENLETIFQGCPFWTEEFKAKLDQDQGIINGNKRRDKEAKRGWQCYEDERKQNVQLFKERAADRAEIKRLQEALQQIAQEVTGAPAAAATPSNIEAKLREQIAGLQDQNVLEVADRGRAFEAVAVLQARLKRAGLPSDYRKQPGE